MARARDGGEARVGTVSTIRSAILGERMLENCGGRYGVR